MTKFNEQTKRLLYKIMPPTPYSRKGWERVAKGLMFLVSER